MHDGVKGSQDNTVNGTLIHDRSSQVNSYIESFFKDIEHVTDERDSLQALIGSFVDFSIVFNGFGNDLGIGRRAHGVGDDFRQVTGCHREYLTG